MINFFFFLFFIFTFSFSSSQEQCKNSDDFWENCYGIYEYDNGDKFIGIYMNDMPYNGTYLDGNGDKYVGQFNTNGVRHGEGVYSFANGQKYVGEFKNGRIHGQGTYYYINGDKYIGEFKNWKQDGYGTFYYVEGDRYEGQHKNDLPHGNGTYFRKDGSVFKGEFINGYFKDSNPISKDEFQEKFSPYSNEEVVLAGSGTGFAISKNGHIITNNHVIESCEKVSVHHQEKTYDSKIIAADKNNDLALLKSNFTPIDILKISEKKPELMQDIFVAGFPFGNEVSSTIKVTKGIVSSLAGYDNNRSLIQIDAAIQPGNSGGPIISEDGHVIGVAVAKLDARASIEEFGVIPENINFGIKNNLVKKLLKDNNIAFLKGNKNNTLNKRRQVKTITNSTFYLSCWVSDYNTN